MQAIRQLEAQVEELAEERSALRKQLHESKRKAELLGEELRGESAEVARLRQVEEMAQVSCFPPLVVGPRAREGEIDSREKIPDRAATGHARHCP